MVIAFDVPVARLVLLGGRTASGACWTGHATGRLALTVRLLLSLFNWTASAYFVCLSCFCSNIPSFCTSLITSSTFCLVSVCSDIQREVLPSTLFILFSNLTNLSKTDVKSISSGVKLGNLLMSPAAKHGSTSISSNFWNAT